MHGVGPGHLHAAQARAVRPLARRQRRGLAVARLRAARALLPPQCHLGVKPVLRAQTEGNLVLGLTAHYTRRQGVLNKCKHQVFGVNEMQRQTLPYSAFCFHDALYYTFGFL